jgi:hypothetical protein
MLNDVGDSEEVDAGGGGGGETDDSTARALTAVSEADAIPSRLSSRQSGEETTKELAKACFLGASAARHSRSNASKVL